MTTEHLFWFLWVAAVSLHDVKIQKWRLRSALLVNLSIAVLLQTIIYFFTHHK